MRQGLAEILTLAGVVGGRTTRWSPKRHRSTGQKVKARRKRKRRAQKKRLQRIRRQRGQNQRTGGRS